MKVINKTTRIYQELFTGNFDLTVYTCKDFSIETVEPRYTVQVRASGPKKRMSH
jgi:hypothetical protein